MNLTNNFNTQTLLVGKSVVKNGSDGEVKYFTVIKANDAPYIISDYVAEELFATRGGKLLCIYVAKVIEQQNMAKENFIYANQLIVVHSIAKDLKPTEIKLFIVQFMAFGTLSIEAIQAESLLQVKRHLFMLCKTYYIVNLIVSKINHTERA